MSIYLLFLFLVLTNILQVKAVTNEYAIYNRTVGDTTFGINFNYFDLYADLDNDGQTTFDITQMMQFDLQASDLKIKFEYIYDETVQSFLEIKCNVVDTTEYIEIRKCNISGRPTPNKPVWHHSFQNEWKIDKKTIYEIENLQMFYYKDSNGTIYIRFGIHNMTIKPQRYIRICSLKQTTMGINANEFTCVSLSPHTDLKNKNQLIQVLQCRGAGRDLSDWRFGALGPVKAAVRDQCPDHVGLWTWPSAAILVATAITPNGS
ncbi:hypothetical protein RF11_03103 [Thelohanellus kitauei]|uniref:Ricin B lectin domain-containing protein n=1 Tax=Thelohanellus kitauei TaxID=669202 RepID=A0A0C2MJP6_THEKT|nr:hypothetical protein RF11_03103 [Thelohanellus kitauei]